MLNIINDSLISGIVPRPLKCAVIKPLLKKPGLNLNVPKHFRPVSNRSYISKLLEQVIAPPLVEHLAKHNLLDRLQSGHSTATAVLHVLWWYYLQCRWWKLGSAGTARFKRNFWHDIPQHIAANTSKWFWYYRLCPSMVPVLSCTSGRRTGSFWVLLW